MVEGIPVGEILKLPPLERAAVVGGTAGLDRVVRHVNVMEVPDILNWVKPDELLLTTAYPLRDERASLEELVPRLYEKGLAGLAVKPDRYIGSIPRAMTEAADRLAFPLIQLPPETSFDDIINSVLGVILNVQALRLERAAAIHDRLNEIVLRGGGLREIAQALSELIARPVGILDPDGRVLATSSEEVLLSAELGPYAWPPSSLNGDGRVQWTTAETSLGRCAVALRPIQVGRELYGAVAAAADEGSLGEEEVVAIERGATVAALRLVQERAIADADRRFQAVCLEELVTGHMTDRAVLRERSVAFGWDLTKPRAVLVAELDGVGGLDLAQLAGTAEEARAWRGVSRAARLALGKRAIIWERSAGIAALVLAGKQAQGLSDLKKEALRVQEEASWRMPGATVSIGIGRLCEEPLDLRYSYAEATRALAVARWARGPGQVAVFQELGLDRLLMSCPEDELAAFCDTTLGTLAEHDRIHRTSLVETLRVYLSNGGNAAEASRQLYVHYNTLKHRLERIEGIIGPFIDDHDRCLMLSLGLRVRRLLGK